MLIGDPEDGFIYPTLTLMMDSYTHYITDSSRAAGFVRVTDKIFIRLVLAPSL